LIFRPYDLKIAKKKILKKGVKTKKGLPSKNTTVKVVL
jgi:hypothetical protein